jgi:hypothetical protein
MKERGKTKFDRGWTRYNCLTKGYEVPDWAREEDEVDWKTELIEKHNREVRKKNEAKTNKRKRNRGSN